MFVHVTQIDGRAAICVKNGGDHVYQRYDDNRIAVFFHPEHPSYASGCNFLIRPTNMNMLTRDERDEFQYIDILLKSYRQ